MPISMAWDWIKKEDETRRKSSAQTRIFTFFEEFSFRFSFPWKLSNFFSSHRTMLFAPVILRFSSHIFHQHTWKATRQRFSHLFIFSSFLHFAFTQNFLLWFCGLQSLFCLLLCQNITLVDVVVVVNMGIFPLQSHCQTFILFTFLYFVKEYFLLKTDTQQLNRKLLFSVSQNCIHVSKP